MNASVFNENRSSLEEILSVNTDLFIKELENKMKKEASLNNFEMASMFKNLINNISYLKYSISKYNELINNNVLLTIPVVEGNKLFYISKGNIIKKEIYKQISQSDIEIFSESALTTTNDTDNMNEKSLVDFRDIIYSEIISMPESMVKFI
jgi:excinuclease ABC subunit C